MTESEKTFQKALKKTADILARRNYSEKELRQKLSLLFTADVVDTVVHKAIEKHWLLPAEELAEAATATWTRGLKSAGYIAEHLAQRGLPAPEISEEDEVEKMKTLLKKKFKNWEDLQTQLSFEERTKAYRFLSSRGFSESLIRKVIHEEP